MFNKLRSQLRSCLAVWLQDDILQADDFLNGLNGNGFWPDIDYISQQAGNWPLLKHLERTKLMALAWSLPDNPSYQNSHMLKGILLAIRFWVDNDFSNPNWWQIKIGVPQSLGTTLVILGPALPSELLKKSMVLLDRSSMGMTGQNRIWLAGINVLKGILKCNSEMIAEGSKTIFSEVVIVPRGNEGLQKDYSFHQHGSQHQFGNYGLAFAELLLMWTIIFRETPFAISPEKLKILADYYTKGLNWTVYRNRMDISACGRQIFDNNPENKARMVCFLNEQLTQIVPKETCKILESLVTGTPISDNRYFWCSDYLICRADDYYFSVRMSSARVIGSESCNDENLLGGLLGHGIAMLRRNGSEYDNMPPVWNWRQLPGITALQDNEQIKPNRQQFENSSNFVGGVSDNHNALAVMTLKSKKLTAQKAWFCFDRFLVNMGSDISSDSTAPVVTAVDQRQLLGKVTVETASESKTLGEGVHNLSGPLLIFQGGVSWYFPDETSLILSNQPEEGNWHKVNAADSAESVTVPVFKLLIPHGVQPQKASYCWITGIYGEDPRNEGIEILTISPEVMGVVDRKNKIIQAAFFSPGKLELPQGGWLEAAQPCIIMLRQNPNHTLTLSAADPTQMLKRLSLKLMGSWTGPNTEGENDITKITIPLLTGANAGQTVSVNLTANSHI